MDALQEHRAGEAQEESNGKAQGGAEPAKSGSAWRPENPLKLLSARVAFPLGTRACGGWRLGLGQPISERLHMDTRLRGML